MFCRRPFRTMTVLGSLASRVLAVATGAVMLSAPARADFTGFPPDLSGFTVNQDDTGNAPSISNGAVHLINGGGEARSIFYNVPQGISQFTASFIYQADGSNYEDPGACFVLETALRAPAR